MSCRGQNMSIESSRIEFERGVRKFERDVRRWTACLATSRWMPIQLIEDWANDKGLCFPLALIRVNNKGKVNIIWLSQM